MPAKGKKYSFYKGISFDNALDFSRRSSYSRDIMLERVNPMRIILPMKQHYGDECIPIVKVGDKVTIGECVGMPPEGAFGAPIHAGISGEVSRIEDCTLPNGITSKAVHIVSDRKKTFHPSIHKRSHVEISAPEVRGIIKNAGIVGLGGEGIPTIYKVNRARQIGVNEILINCLQNEPYVTSDLIRLSDYPDYVVMGAIALAGASDASKITFLLGERMTKEADAIRASIARLTNKNYSEYSYGIKFFKSRYPQGYYRLIAKALYGKTLRRDQTLEEECKAVLFNCSTCYACFEAIADGMPFHSRIVTLCSPRGEGHNILAPIGTPVTELLDSVNGISETSSRILLGNLLTGTTVSDPDNTPIIKTTKAISVVSYNSKIVSSCIRCNECVRACPIELKPNIIKALIDSGYKEKAIFFRMQDCIHCAACSYVCPSGIRLYETIRESFESSSSAGRWGRRFSSLEKYDELLSNELKNSRTLLEEYDEESSSSDSSSDDSILLPFEGGKIV